MSSCANTLGDRSRRCQRAPPKNRQPGGPERASPAAPFRACTPETAGGIEALNADLRADAEAARRAAVDRVPVSIPVTKTLSTKPIREVLMEQIRSDRYDLVVMGSRGRGALSASFLGSVSHFALNHSHVPVLIVHDEDDRELNRAAEGEPPVAAAA